MVAALFQTPLKMLTALFKPPVDEGGYHPPVFASSAPRSIEYLTLKAPFSTDIGMCSSEITIAAMAQGIPKLETRHQWRPLSNSAY